MNAQEFVTLNVAARSAKMESMTDDELEAMRLECWQAAKTADTNKFKNAASWISQIQTQRKYA